MLKSILSFIYIPRTSDTFPRRREHCIRYSSYVFHGSRSERYSEDYITVRNMILLLLYRRVRRRNGRLTRSAINYRYMLDLQFIHIRSSKCPPRLSKGDFPSFSRITSRDICPTYFQTLFGSAPR